MTRVKIARRLPGAARGGSPWQGEGEAGGAGGGRAGGRDRRGVAGREPSAVRGVSDRERGVLPDCWLVVHRLWADRVAAAAGQPAGAGDGLYGLRLVRDVLDRC